MTESDIARRFATEGANHAMEITHDDGLYRHLRFRAQVWCPPLADPQTSFHMWFDLITVPGTLIFQGDGTSYVFSRVTDMFAFFRSPAGTINPHYWAEKLTSCTREDAKTYDEALFKQLVTEHVKDATLDGAAPAGLAQAVRDQVLNDSRIYYEAGAREALEYFVHDGYQFTDVWEWDFRSYDWWFLWACHAIVWGIALYDAHKAGRERPTFPVQPEASAAAAPAVPSRSMVTVHLPGGDA